MTGPGPTGGSGRATWVVVAIGVLLILAIVGPVILMSQPLSIADLAVMSVSILVIGLVVRRRPDARSRSIGSVVSVIGAFLIVAVIALFLVALGGSGRI